MLYQCICSFFLQYALCIYFSVSISAACLHLNLHLTNWLLMLAWERIKQVFTFFLEICFCYFLFYMKLVKKILCSSLSMNSFTLKVSSFKFCLRLRGNVLVDDPSSIQTEVRRWEGASWRWPHTGQCVIWEIPGESEKKQFIFLAKITLDQ